MKKKVTVIITTHERPVFFERAIRSVLSQSIDIHQLILVLNAVDNNTRAIANNYAKQYQNILILETEHFLNGSEARNFSINRITGEYVAFLDDDDYWFNTKIEKQLDIMERDGAGVVYTGIRRLISKDAYYDVVPTLQGNVQTRIFSEIPSITSAILFDRKLFTDELFDEKLTHWQEYELLIRLSKQVNFSFVPEILTVIQDDNSGKKDRLSSNLDKWEKAVLYVRQKHADRIKSLPTTTQQKFETLYLKDRINRKEQQKFGWVSSIPDKIILIKNSNNIKYVLLLVPGITISKFARIKQFISNRGHSTKG